MVQVDKILYTVAYSLKARTVKSQQPAVTRQQPVNNNKGMVFSPKSVYIVMHATKEYFLPLLSNNLNLTEEVCFLRGSYRDILCETI
jgi:hypothetical protein